MKPLIALMLLPVLLFVGCTPAPPSSQSESAAGSYVSSSQSLPVSSAPESSSSVSDGSRLSNGEYEYQIIDQAVTILEYIGRKEDITVPDTIDGYPVTAIGEYAFFGYYGTIKLPDSIEVIELGAFEQSGIAEFVFPPKVKVIRECVFYESKLQKVALPERVEVIEGEAFGITLLTEIFIPDSVTVLDDVFHEHFRSFILLYDNNPVVEAHAKENNILYCKRSEYHSEMEVELVGDQPLNDEENLGISREDYNHIGRQSMHPVEFDIVRYPNERDDFDYIAYEHGLNNVYSGFFDGEDLSEKVVKAKLQKLSKLLYQCGITEYDPKTVNTGEVGCFDNLVKAALHCRWPNTDLFYYDALINDNGLTFSDKEVLFVDAFGLFGFIPDASLVTGYSEVQKGIWYYPKQLEEVTTEVLSFSGNMEDGNYMIKVRCTEASGDVMERTLAFSILPYSNVSGSCHRILLRSIR